MRKPEYNVFFDTIISDPVKFNKNINLAICFVIKVSAIISLLVKIGTGMPKRLSVIKYILKQTFYHCFC